MTYTTGPCLYAVEVGHWLLPEDQAEQLREYLLRGGFFMCDDFHGDQPWEGNNEWEVFTNSMNKVFPDLPIEEIPNNDPIFHTLYDLDDRFQVPGSSNYFDTGHHLRKRSQRQGAALALHPRRQGPHHGRHLPQHGSGRRLGEFG